MHGKYRRDWLSPLMAELRGTPGDPLRYYPLACTLGALGLLALAVWFSLR